MRDRTLVSQTGDDTREEEREGIERKSKSVEGETVEPAFIVAQCAKNRAPSEGFGSCGIAVDAETMLKDLAFRNGEERSGRRVVDDEPVRREGDENGHNAYTIFSNLTTR